jgi:hypothetical protein
MKNNKDLFCDAIYLQTQLIPSDCSDIFTTRFVIPNSVRNRAVTFRQARICPHMKAGFLLRRNDKDVFKPAKEISQTITQ